MRKRTKYIYTATTLENLSKGHHHDNITYRRLDHIPLEELFSRNMKKGRTQCRSFRSVQDLGKGVSGKAYPRLCNARRPRLETLKLNHIEKKIHLHSHWQFSTIGRRGERTTTEEFTITKLNGHPTLDGSKERVACMENPEEQIHVLNQDYEVVPSVATFAP